jgi:hypothetical protein
MRTRFFPHLVLSRRVEATRCARTISTSQSTFGDCPIRPLRIEFAGALCHLTSRGDRREAIYEDDEDRQLFLAVLAEVAKRYDWICHAYCLMANHYHLVAETVKGQRLGMELMQADKVLASVCHGPACFVGALLRDGTPVVKERRVTSFTDQEERAVELEQHMLFLLQSELREMRAKFVPAVNWQDNLVVDGRAVTGQTPQSSASAGRAVIRLLSA